MSRYIKKIMITECNISYIGFYYKYEFILSKNFIKIEPIVKAYCSFRVQIFNAAFFLFT